jgi:CSLREA domain-containing protein
MPARWIDVPRLALAAFAAALLLAPAPAAAETFRVNSPDDQPDVSLDDTPNECNADPRKEGFKCTLRAAIQEANRTDGHDTIEFHLSAGDVQTIDPDAFLPPITEATTIDGYTQPGSRENTSPAGQPLNTELRVALTGRGSDLSNGLVIADGVSGSVIRGLVINGFQGDGIRVSATTGQGNVIAGNFIGTDPTGTTAVPNGFAGVDVTSGHNTRIGGTLAADRNLISGNTGGAAVALASTAPGPGSIVQGNLIGTQKDGRSALANAGDGVLVTGTNNTIGGSGPGAENVIAFNRGQGVSVEDPGSVGNRVLSNSIFSNLRLGIDLNGDDRTANDTRDLDTGPNLSQNYPALRSAVAAGGGTTISCQLTSVAGRSYLVQFFSNPSGTGQGETLIGQRSVTTSPAGTASCTFRKVPAVALGRTITATATGPDGNTSEFSPRVIVGQPVR